MMQRATIDLLVALQGHRDLLVRDDEEARRSASTDASNLPPLMPAAVIFPKNINALSLAAAEAYQRGVSMTARGGGSGKCGGCLTDENGIIVDMRKLVSLRELNPEDRYVELEAGFCSADVDTYAESQGFYYAPDPGGAKQSTLGGNIATNAGGMRALKYASTGAHVLGLEVVLPDGRLMNLGRRARKGVSGYLGEQLFVASEGTLGFITAARMKLLPRPKHRVMAWLAFDSPTQALLFSTEIFQKSLCPSVLEWLDLPSILAQRAHISELGPWFFHEALLLLEFDQGFEQNHQDLQTLEHWAQKSGASGFWSSEDKTTMAAWRSQRNATSLALKAMYPAKLSDDVALPRSRMIQFWQRLERIREESGIKISAYGHLGDGNLHVNYLCKSEAERRGLPQIRDALMTCVRDLGGVCSGEHGIGISKRKFHLAEQDTSWIEFERSIKKIFDPKGLMNPGKIF